MSKNFDLNEKINLIYNFNYNKNFPSCFELDKVILKNISMRDIKISDKNKDVFNEVLTDLFKGNFKLLEYTPDNKTTIIKRYSEQFPLTLFITPYHKSIQSKLITSPNNNDSLFSYFLSSLVFFSTKSTTSPIILSLATL